MHSPIQLLISRPDGGIAYHRLADNETVTVGSKKTCGLRLSGEDVSPIHCLLKTLNGQLCVQDWYASSGTLVAGHPVSESTMVHPGDEIRVGSFTITWMAEADRDEPAVACEEAAAPVEAPCACDPSIDEISALNVDWESPLSCMTVDQEAVELLRSEVDRLQSELAVRDEQVQVLTEQLASLPDQNRDTSENFCETGKLVARMEELLDELESSDARISQLQESLRCSEDAAQAEHDERAQLEAWITEIEHRVTQREEESRAGQEALQQRLRELIEQRDQFKTQLRSLASTSPVGPGRDAESARLREENDKLHQTVERLQQSQAAAEQSAARAEQEKVSIRAQVEGELREEHIRLAQERALLTRQQSEHAALRAELVKVSDSQRRNESDADARLRAFRDHLREIHDREQCQQSERTLGARLAQLWRRVEKRNES